MGNLGAVYRFYLARFLISICKFQQTKRVKSLPLAL
jgi:hypothetical protein